MNLYLTLNIAVWCLLLLGAARAGIRRADRG